MTELEQVEFHGPVRGPGGGPRRRLDGGRVALLAAAGVLMVIGVAAAMSALPSAASGADPSASPAPATTSAPEQSGAPAAPANPVPKGDRPSWKGLAGPFGGFGRAGFRDITISAIDGANVSLKTDDGWTRTITVTSSTKITKGGKTIGIGELAVGDQVRLGQERQSDGSYTVTAIVVVLPTVVGEVKSIDGDTITITQPGGTTATIHVGSGTTYQVRGSSGSLSDIKVGSIVIAEGTQRSDGSLDAAIVRGGQMRPFGPGPGFKGGGHGAKPGATSPAPSSGTS